MTNWPERVRRLIAAKHPSREVLETLRTDAAKDPEAARELGHMLLQVSWSETQTDGYGYVPGAEKWLRQAAAARPQDVEATLLLATLLSIQCRQLWDMALETRHSKRWDEARKRRSVEACGLYERALQLDPHSSAAAGGLALLRENQSIAGDGRSAVTEAGDLDEARSHRFDYFVLRVELLVTNNGDTVTRWVVLRDLEQLWGFDTCAWEISKPVAFQYERGIQVATHRPARLSSRSLAQVAEEWHAKRDMASQDALLPVGHPARHDGKTLHYGVNGAQMADGPL
ncbi:hypothetical protein [Nonomuraea sp. NEAU-A123]|uniref:hypothetical protein n=1 Tax=Nonomuraea sp. NEAU-A123 TaxID=2839649 RepID=UPI001BE4E114|nr:hypothetical protein [Nonomuraea sp. NEAU-A123]MBT2224824.1 hypothetical protein [Nonomuraea sp. NEAU-A123]